MSEPCCTATPRSASVTDAGSAGSGWPPTTPTSPTSLGPLGPDAARITATQLHAALDHRRTALKTALMDQAAIAGIGNTLSDEVLWRARLHPQTRADSLSPPQLAHLHAALRDRVRRAARAGAIPRTPPWLTSQRGSSAPMCPRCGAPLERTRVTGRTALWCPRCQGAQR